MKKWLAIMTDEAFLRLSPEDRQSFETVKVLYDDHEEHKEDERYMTFYKAYRKAQKALENYKFDKRHK